MWHLNANWLFTEKKIANVSFLSFTGLAGQYLASQYTIFTHTKKQNKRNMENVAEMWTTTTTTLKEKKIDRSSPASEVKQMTTADISTSYNNKAFLPSTISHLSKTFANIGDRVVQSIYDSDSHFSCAIQFFVVRGYIKSTKKKPTTIAARILNEKRRKIEFTRKKVKKRR